MKIPRSSEAVFPWPIFHKSPLASPPPVATKVASVGLHASENTSSTQEGIGIS